MMFRNQVTYMLHSTPLGKLKQQQQTKTQTKPQGMCGLMRKPLRSINYCKKQALHFPSAFIPYRLFSCALKLHHHPVPSSLV